MTERSALPLDQAQYATYLAELAEIVRRDPQLEDTAALRAFVEAHREWFGPRTARTTLSTDDTTLRTLIHIMVLAASELADLHPASRAWLADHRQSLPPWDVTVPRTAQRLVTFHSRVYGVVEWQPEPRIELAPHLTEQERRWATALAIAIGERPQWSTHETARYAAYLTLGTESFRDERDLPDEILAERHSVPVEAVRYRRNFGDTP
jgi:hypothetical protein